MKILYALLTIIGTILPFSQFIKWLTKYGFNPSLFFQQIFENPLTTFAWFDIFVTVIVIVLMIINDGKIHKMKKLWVPILASFLGGASVGLPLFLYMKQCHLEKSN